MEGVSKVLCKWSDGIDMSLARSEYWGSFGMSLQGISGPKWISIGIRESNPLRLNCIPAMLFELHWVAKLAMTMMLCFVNPIYHILLLSHLVLIILPCYHNSSRHPVLLVIRLWNLKVGGFLVWLAWIWLLCHCLLTGFWCSILEVFIEEFSRIFRFK